VPPASQQNNSSNSNSNNQKRAKVDQPGGGGGSAPAILPSPQVHNPQANKAYAASFDGSELASIQQHHGNI
jgi:hypothetical protein